MRKLMFLALGAIVGLSFTACGNKQAQTGVYSDSTEVDSSKLKDVVVYGLCGDNAAMVGSQAYYEYQAGVRAKASLNAVASLSIGDTVCE